MQKVSDIHKSKKNKVLIICGPTATGKTKLALSLAHEFHGELVNADSRQMYQGMDILSGKDIPFGVTPQVREQMSIKGEEFSLVTYDIDGIPLWLYDVSSLMKPLSISHFQTLATHVIFDIQKRKKLPIVVGGTGFYLSSLVGTIPTLHIPQNQILRDELYKKSVTELQHLLSADDPSRWLPMNESDRNNPRRLVRAIEVAKWNSKHTIELPQAQHAHAFWIGLRMDPKILSQRIKKRVSDRFDGGVVEEVKQLGEISDELPGSSMLGLSVLQKYIRGDISKDDVEHLWVTEELQYAKRQMVWFARQANIHWFDIEKSDALFTLEKLVCEWYT